MHDLLFSSVPEWGRETPRPVLSLGPIAPDLSPEQKTAEARATFAGYAEKLGLDVERFKKDMDSEQVRARIRSGPGTRRFDWSRPDTCLIHERRFDPV